MKQVGNRSGKKDKEWETDSVRLVQTARDTDDRLRSLPALRFTEVSDPGQTEVRVDPGQTFQPIIGFGGAFTEAGAHALSRLSPAKRQEVLRAYFDPEVGSRYNLCRTHINSCDFALGNYAYCEQDGDFELENFDISRDREWLIPFIRDAQALAGPGLRIFASPWSPPAWMKTTGEMNHGGQLRPDCREVWALYYARYVQAYAGEGIPIWGLTVQNEPQATQTWDSCIYSHEEERDFVRDHLGPRLAAEGLADLKLMVWDHNKDLIAACADVILSDPEAAKYVWGVGFHWYSGDQFEELDKVHDRFPGKALVFTEGCAEKGVKLGSWELGERYGHAIIGDLNHWTTGWVDWNMVLDETGGPNHVGNFCDAPIIADGTRNMIHYQNAYHYIGHFSRYIEPGAHRIGITVENPALEAVACRNPGGDVAVVVMNSTEEAQTYALRDGTRSVSIEIPARAMQTVGYLPGGRRPEAVSELPG